MKTGWKWFWRVLGVLVLVLLVAGALFVYKMRTDGFLRDPVFETERQALPELAHPAVLVFSKTNQFIHHEAIPAARQALQELATQNGWSVFASDSGAVFNPEDLAHFDVVVWNNVTGDVLLPAQREAFKAWLEQGGGFVGLHAAGDNSHDVWPWYQDSVIGAHFIGHPLSPQFQQARLRIERADDPLVAPLPDPWTRTDEWYSFAASPRAAGVSVLVTIDEQSYAPGSFFGKPLAMGADHPMIWKRCVGKGRALYAAPGHTAETYAEPEYRALLVRAVAWAGGFAPPSGANPLACESPTTGTQP